MNIKEDNFFKNSKEIFNYKVVFEINNNEEVFYKHIFVEGKEILYNYCIVVANDGYYYVGEIIENKTVVCWARFKKFEKACAAL